MNLEIRVRRGDQDGEGGTAETRARGGEESVGQATVTGHKFANI